MPWRIQRHLPDGHRLFQLDRSELYAIADDSGTTPVDTDDGTLFIDKARPLAVAYDTSADFPHCYCSIPLVSGREHKQTRTPSDVATLLLLGVEFDWPILVQDADGSLTTYEVKEVTNGNGH